MIAADPEFLIFRQARPATDSVGFVMTDLETLISFVDRWKTPQGLSGRPTRFQAPLPTALGRLLPLTSLRTIYIECRGGWTAVFRSESQFKEGEVSKPCQELGVEGIKANYCYADDDPDNHLGKNGAIQFSTYKEHSTDFLNHGRSVYVACYEGKWEFGEGGEPEPYERLDAYKARRIKDRFTLDMLIEYLRANGIDPCDPSFFTDRCAMIDKRHK